MAAPSRWPTAAVRRDESAAEVLIVRAKLLVWLLGFWSKSGGHHFFYHCVFRPRQDPLAAVMLCRRLLCFTSAFLSESFARLELSRDRVICSHRSESLSSNQSLLTLPVPHARSGAGLFAGGDALHPKAAGAASSSPQ